MSRLLKVALIVVAGALAITEPVTAVRAGVRYESRGSVTGVDQLDLLDQDRCRRRNRATTQRSICGSFHFAEQLADLLQPNGGETLEGRPPSCPKPRHSAVT